MLSPQPTQSNNEYLLRDELGGLYVLSERSRNRGLKDIEHFVSAVMSYITYIHTVHSTYITHKYILT